MQNKTVLCLAPLLLFVSASVCFAVDTSVAATGAKPIYHGNIGHSLAAAGPQALWSVKNSAFSMAVSSDGTRVAMTVLPICPVAEKGGEYFHYGLNISNWDNADCKDMGKLYVFDADGRMLWTFPSAQDNGVKALYGTSMSGDGKFVAVSVGQRPCHDEVWQIDSSDYKNAVARGTVPVSHVMYLGPANESLDEYKRKFNPEMESVHGKYELFESSGSFIACGYSIPAKARLCGRETVVFSGDGKKLWSYPGRGLPKVSPDGRYVLVIPDVRWNDTENVYGNSWQLFDMRGKLLKEKTVQTQAEALDVYKLEEDGFTSGPFSRDGKHFLFAGKVWKYNAGEPVELATATLPDDDRLRRISPDGNYVVGKGKVIALGEAKFADVSAVLPSDFVVTWPYDPYDLLGLEPFVEKFYLPKIAFVDKYAIAIIANSSSPDDGLSGAAEDDMPGDSVSGKVTVFDLKSAQKIVDVPGSFWAVYSVSDLNFIASKMENEVSKICLYSIPDGVEKWCANMDCSQLVLWPSDRGFICNAYNKVTNYRILP